LNVIVAPSGVITVKGEQVGQAVITPDGATITFNDKVEKLSDVSGFP
jgi:hypothetical protein